MGTRRTRELRSAAAPGGRAHWSAGAAAAAAAGAPGPQPEPRAPRTSESLRATATATAKPRPATPPPRRPQRGAPPPRRPLPAVAGWSSQLGEGSGDGFRTEGGSGKYGGPEQGRGDRLCLPPNLQELRGTKLTFVSDSVAPENGQFWAFLGPDLQFTQIFWV